MNLAGNGIVTGFFVNLSGGYEGKTLSPFKVILLNGKIASNENIVSIFWGDSSSGYPNFQDIQAKHSE